MARYLTTKEIEESLAKIDALENRLNEVVSLLNAQFETFRSAIHTSLNEHRNLIIEMREEIQNEHKDRRIRRARAIERLKSE